MLKDLLKYLLALKDENDVRDKIRRDFFIKNIPDIPKGMILDT